MTNGARAFALLLAATLPGIAQAQDEATEITVVGTALPDAKANRVFANTIIEQERLTSTASGRLEDGLRDVAGLQQFRRTDARSANATSQGATLRGLGGNASSRTLLLLDGVPQTDPFGGWVTWPAFAPERLRSVRVTRGGGSGADGPGALSGTIALESIGTGVGLSGGLAYGSRNSVDANALLRGKLGRGFGFIAASFARGDGFTPIVRRFRGPADRPAPYRQASIAIRGVAMLSNQTEVQAGLLGFSDARTRGTALSQNGGKGGDASIRLVHRGRWGLEALGYAQIRSFLSRFVAVDASRSTVTQTVDQYSVPSTGLGGRVELRPPLGSRVELRLGGDWRRTSGQANEFFTYVAGQPTRFREAGGENETLGGFMELTGKVGPLSLTANARLDKWWIRDGRLVERVIATGVQARNERAANRNGTEPTARIGAAWKSGPLTIRAAAYLGWRLPTLNELYRPFRVGTDATAANPALRPERMRGAEIGLRWAVQDRFHLDITLFENRLIRPIANVTLGAGPGLFPGVGFVAAGGAYRQRQNLDAIDARGLELGAGFRLGRFTLSASYAYTDALIVASATALPLNGLGPAQVPLHMASATLGWGEATLSARYVSGQFEDDLNQRRLRPAFTIDAFLPVQLSSRMTLFFRAENILDVSVDAAISPSGVVERATPRTLWIGIRIKP